MLEMDVGIVENGPGFVRLLLTFVFDFFNNALASRNNFTAYAVVFTKGAFRMGKQVQEGPRGSIGPAGMLQRSRMQRMFGKVSPEWFS